jgi:hypothetical protein
MPERETLRRVRKDAAEGKSAGTQAGEFIREEMHHIREGKHGARSAKQAIAIGLSKARRAGVKLKVPAPGTTSPETRKQAIRDSARAKRSGGRKKISAARSRASLKRLKEEGRSAASHLALSRHARAAAREHSAAERSASARKAARTRAQRGL